MKVLICAATEMEIAPTIHFLSTHHNYKYDILITGIGLMSATYALVKSVTTHHPDLIIQAGIAGSLDPSLSLSEVVVVGNESIGDLGVMEGDSFHSLFDMKFLSQDIHPWHEGKLSNTNEIVSLTGLKIVDAVTVNEITTGTERINYYRNSLKAEVETMEGAALHYVGLMEKIPFLQLRSLSNFIGERHKTKWMMKEAISNLNHQLQNILTKQLTDET